MPSSAVDSGPPSTGAYLYVADCCGVLNNGDVTVYDPNQTKVARRIIRGAADPIAIALDSTGTLYVLNQSQGGPEGVAVTEYSHGQRRPARRIQPFYWATTIALDKNDHLYVANCNTCVDSGARKASATHDSVTEYRARQANPMRTITRGVHTPYSLAVDGASNLYVGNGGIKGRHPNVTVYRPESIVPSRVIAWESSYPRALAFDEQQDLFVAYEHRCCSNYSASVVEYGPRSDRVNRTITQELSGIQAMVIDGTGTLYVANWPSSPSGPGWISVYAPDSSSPKYTITDGVNQPVALAVDGANNVYVANIGNDFITVYAAHGKKPTRKIAGNRFGPPRALALGAK